MASERIARRTHPVVRRLRGLARPGARGTGVLIEGVKVAREALASSIELVEAIISPRLESHPDGRPLAAALRARGIEVHDASDAVLEAVATTRSHQGVILVGRARPIAIDALARPELRPRLVVASGIQEPGNLGGLVRTAEALGFDGLLRIGGADPWGSKAIRAASGSTFRLPIADAADAPAALAALTSAGYHLVATVARGGRPAAPDLLRPPVAILFGGEGGGLDESERHASALEIEIPLRHPVESLNVGAAAAIILWLARPPGDR